MSDEDFPELPADVISPERVTLATVREKVSSVDAGMPAASDTSPASAPVATSPAETPEATTERAATSAGVLRERVSPDFLHVVLALRDSLRRATSDPLLAIAESLARGECDTDSPAWREAGAKLIAPIMRCANETLGKGVATAEVARSFGPARQQGPTRTGAGNATDARLVSEIVALRQGGAGACEISKRLSPALIAAGRPRALPPSWVRQVYLRQTGGDPAPVAVRQPDEARERRRLETAVARATALGLSFGTGKA